MNTRISPLRMRELLTLVNAYKMICCMLQDRSEPPCTSSVVPNWGGGGGNYPWGKYKGFSTKGKYKQKLGKYKGGNFEDAIGHLPTKR